jgi:hypothetical protein
MSDLSIDKVASISHAMSIHRTMFIKPSMSHNHSQSNCGDKGASHSITTCHHCGISGVIFVPIASRFVYKNLGIKHMYLGKMNQVLRTKSRS